MAGYTPTTEEVRTIVQGASPEEFDRWLAEVKAEAVKRERKRITKALKKMTIADRMGYVRLDSYWPDIKAEIRGENSE